MRTAANLDFNEKPQNWYSLSLSFSLLSVLISNLGKQAVWHCGVAYEDESPVDKFTMHVAQPRKVKKREHLGAVEVKKVIPAADFCLFLSGRIFTV